MKKQLLSFFILFATATCATYAQEHLVSGRILETTGSPIIGASVVIQGTTIGAASDADGKYQLKLAPGDYTIEVDLIGYQTAVKAIQVVDADQTIDITLTETSVDLADVVVLGSRSATARTNLEKPVPVDVIDMTQAVQTMPQVNLNSILNYTAPSFTSTTQTVADGSDHIDPAALRGLGPDQTLILVNGKRRHTTALVNTNGTFGRGSVGTDLNAIPSIAIQRLEVLRDGAAAQYGSDAIAGVINLGLRRNNKGTEALVTYGANVSTFESYNEAGKGNFLQGIDPTYHKTTVFDGQVVQAAINQGLSLGKNGFVNLSATFDWRTPTNRAGEGTGPLTASASASTPATLAADDAFLARNNLIRNDIRNRVGQAALLGGQFFLNSEYTVDKATKSVVYLFGGVSYRDGNSAANYRKPGNAGNVLTVAPLGFLPLIRSEILDISAAAGVKGKIHQWNYDLSNTFGRNYFHFITDHSLNASAASRQNYAAGEKAGIAIDSLQSRFDASGLSFIQNTVNLDFARMFPVLDGLNVAFGGETRWEQFRQVAGEEASWMTYNFRSPQDNTLFDPFGITSAGIGNGKGGGAQGFSGISSRDALTASRHTFAGYVDLEQEFTEWAVLNIAGRFEDFSDFGHNFSGKIAARINATKWLAFRGSASTGFRAPSLHQRYTQTVATLTSGGVVSQTGVFRNDSELAKGLGIPSLKPEISFSFSGGFTINAKKVKITVDAYNIRIRDRILYTGNFVADAITKPYFDAVGASKGIFFANALNTNTTGVDAVVSYTNVFNGIHNLKVDLSGSFVKNTQVGDVIASDQLKSQLNNYIDPTIAALLFTSIPRFKGNLIANYSIKKWSFFARESYIGETTEVSGPFDFNVGGTNGSYYYKQAISGVFITDVSVSYPIVKNLKLTLGVNNLFDTYTALINAEKGRFYRLETDATKADYNQLGPALTAQEVGVADNDSLTSGSSLGNQFNYPTSVSMIGLNGRFLFVRLNFNL